MRPTPIFVIHVLLGVAIAIAGIVVLANLPAGDNTVQLAEGIGLILTGIAVAIPRPSTGG